MIYTVEIEEMLIEYETLTDIEREAAEIMRRAEEFLPPDVRNPPKIRYLSETGLSTRGVVFAGLSAAAWALTGVTVAYAAIQAVQAAAARKTDREVRKTKTHLCVTKCLQIIGAARGEAGPFKKYASFRALETVDSQQRNRRKFRSRK